MTDVRVSLVDVYPVRVQGAVLEVLVLRRAAGGRCPGSSEVVHGHREPGETPAGAACRELLEETGLVPERLYNLSRVELFYQHSLDEVSFVPVFVAIVPSEAGVRLSGEHDSFAWLDFGEARRRLSWPRSIRALDDIDRLLPGGDPGPVGDVLLISATH